MKRRDVYVLLAAVLLAGVLLLVGSLAGPQTAQKALPTLTLAGQTKGPLEPADSYLRIKQGDQYYHLLPLNGPGEYIIRQDKGYENIIHIDKNSVVMHSANCPTQDCVRMGMMTLDNIETRFYGSFITCLPHKLSLELIPREQAQHLEEAPQ